MIIWLALGWHAGVAAFNGWPAGWPVWPAWLLAVAALAVGIWQRAHRRNRNIAALVVALCLAFLRTSLTQPQIDAEHVAAHVGNYLTWEGVVVGYPLPRDGAVDLRIQPTMVFGDGERQPIARGLVLVRVDAGPQTPQYGDLVRFRTTLETPARFADFDYAAYLARRDVFATAYYVDVRSQGPATCADDLPAFGWHQCLWLHLRKPIFALRAYAYETLIRIFPEPAAALLAGILLGIETGIPGWLDNAFRLTGTSHIVAISGFNIVIIGQVFARALGRVLPPGATRWVAVLGITAYSLLAGAEASVVRAAVMTGIVLIFNGLSRGSKREGLYGLSLATLLILGVDPRLMWDVGYQLSLAATLGLVVYTDPMTTAVVGFFSRWWDRERVAQAVGLVSEVTLVTIAAQIAVLPLLAYYFGQVSLISLVANVVILPVQPAVMLLGGLADIAGMVWQPLGQLLAWVAWPAVAFTIEAARLLAQVPLAVVPVPAGNVVWLLTAYGLLVALSAAVLRRPDERPAWLEIARAQWLPNAAVLALLAAAMVLWQAALARPDGRLHVHLLDVGGGRAVLVVTPGGRAVLIDAGPSPNRLADQLAGELPLTQRTLDLLVVTDGDDALTGGLEALNIRYSVDEVFVQARDDGSRAYADWRQALARSGTAIRTSASTPQARYALGDGAELALTDAGVWLLSYGNARFVLPPPLNDDALAALPASANLPPTAIWLMPDGRAAALLDPAAVDALRPTALVLPVDARDATDAAAAQWLARQQQLNLLRSDVNGHIHFSTDGQRLWVSADYVP